MPIRDLKKLFRSAEETDDPEIGTCQGQIPDFLIGGALLRTGPGMYDLKGTDFVFKHLLDGYAILSKFEFLDAKTVRFTKKYLNSESYTRAVRAKKPVVAEFATRAYPDPEKNILLRHLPNMIPELTDNGNISIYTAGDRIFASNETNFIREVHPSTMTCAGGRVNTLKIFGLNSVSAHPIVDPWDGWTYYVGNAVFSGLKYKIIKIPPPTAEASQTTRDWFKGYKVLASIPTSFLSNLSLSYIHTFALTRSYIIFLEQPLTLNVGRIAKASLTRGQSSIDWMDWRGGETTTKFVIIEKSSGKILDVDIYSKDPFFFLHAINAHEVKGQDGVKDHLVLDICAFPDATFILKTLEITRLRAGADEEEGRCEPSALRYIIPLITKEELKAATDGADFTTPNAIYTNANAKKSGEKLIITPEVLLDWGVEFPCVNPKVQGSKNRFFYVSGSASNGDFRNCICKYDTETRGHVLWRESEYFFPGEPVFVENPDNSNGEEDDGVLLVPVSDSRDQSFDFLLILNAKDLKEVARVPFKAQIHFDFHGIFIKEGGAGE